MLKLYFARVAVLKERRLPYLEKDATEFEPARG